MNNFVKITKKIRKLALEWTPSRRPNCAPSDVVPTARLQPFRKPTFEIQKFVNPDLNNKITKRYHFCNLKYQTRNIEAIRNPT